MTDSNVIKLAQPGACIDSLTEILRNGTLCSRRRSRRRSLTSSGDMPI